MQEGKYVISLGGAPMNKGFLDVWSVADGKMLLGEELPWGSFFALAVAPDGKALAADRIPFRPTVLPSCQPTV